MNESLDNGKKKGKGKKLDNFSALGQEKDEFFANKDKHTESTSKDTKDLNRTADPSSKESARVRIGKVEYKDAKDILGQIEKTNTNETSRLIIEQVDQEKRDKEILQFKSQIPNLIGIPRNPEEIQEFRFRLLNRINGIHEYFKNNYQQLSDYDKDALNKILDLALHHIDQLDKAEKRINKTIVTDSKEVLTKPGRRSHEEEIEKRLFNRPNQVAVQPNSDVFPANISVQDLATFEDVIPEDFSSSDAQKTLADEIKTLTPIQKRLKNYVKDLSKRLESATNDASLEGSQEGEKIIQGLREELAQKKTEQRNLESKMTEVFSKITDESREKYLGIKARVENANAPQNAETEPAPVPPAEERLNEKKAEETIKQNKEDSEEPRKVSIFERLNFRIFDSAELKASEEYIRKLQHQISEKESELVIKENAYQRHVDKSKEMEKLPMDAEVRRELVKERNLLRDGKAKVERTILQLRRELASAEKSRDVIRKKCDAVIEKSRRYAEKYEKDRTPQLNDIKQKEKLIQENLKELESRKDFFAKRIMRFESEIENAEFNSERMQYKKLLKDTRFKISLLDRRIKQRNDELIPLVGERTRLEGEVGVEKNRFDSLNALISGEKLPEISDTPEIANEAKKQDEAKFESAEKTQNDTAANVDIDKRNRNETGRVSINRYADAWKSEFASSRVDFGAIERLLSDLNKPTVTDLQNAIRTHLSLKSSRIWQTWPLSVVWNFNLDRKFNRIRSSIG